MSTNMDAVPAGSTQPPPSGMPPSKGATSRGAEAPAETRGGGREALHARLGEISSQLEYLVERQRRTEEFLDEMMPIAREVMSTSITHLDELEKRNYFAFGRELLGIVERVATGFTPRDARMLGDAVVNILETVRALTQPEVLSIANEASVVLKNAAETEPMGIVGMVRATRDDDVQRGMAVMMELMRHVGRAAEVMQRQREESPIQKRAERLAAVTGARRSKALGVERVTSQRTGAREGGTGKSSKEAAERAGNVCVPSGLAPAGAPVIVEGIAFHPDGHMVDPQAWTEQLAGKLAATSNIELTDAHWTVIRFVRSELATSGLSPNIRRITQGTGLSTRDLYALFPKAPARTAARIAGAPKPAGCV